MSFGVSGYNHPNYSTGIGSAGETAKTGSTDGTGSAGVTVLDGDTDNTSTQSNTQKYPTTYTGFEQQGPTTVLYAAAPTGAGDTGIPNFFGWLKGTGSSSSAGFGAFDGSINWGSMNWGSFFSMSSAEMTRFTGRAEAAYKSDKGFLDYVKDFYQMMYPYADTEEELYAEMSKHISGPNASNNGSYSIIGMLYAAYMCISDELER